MNDTPKTAFIMAAGEGVRMRPLTLKTPKPLLQAGSKPILEYTLEALEKAGIREVFINVRHLGDQIIAYCEDYKGLNIRISDERDVLPDTLETGGGILRVRDHLPQSPFFVCNGDAFTVEDPGGPDAFDQLWTLWDPDHMDILLLLSPTPANMSGDYEIGPDGQLTWSKAGSYVYSSKYILNPAILDEAPSPSFSMKVLFDAAERKSRLYGCVHQGQFHHFTRPEDLQKCPD